MKHFTKFASLAIVAVMALGVLAACDFSAPVSPNATATGMTYISMRINPEIEMVADENGTVVAVNPVNEDGEVVLTDTELVGMSVEDAGTAFTEAATELGYIDTQSEDNTVYVDVLGENEEIEQQMEAKLSEKITHFFPNKGIGGKVSPETLEKYADKVDEWGVSAGHAKTILRVLELYPEMTEQEVLALSVPERLALIKDYAKNSGLTVKLQKQLKADKEALREQYAEMFALEQQIKDLEKQLQSKDLTEEQKAELHAQYEQAKQRCDELHTAYREAITTLKNAHKQELQAQKEQAKEQGISQDKLHLIQAILELSPDQSQEELADMEVKELKKLYKQLDRNTAKSTETETTA